MVMTHGGASGSRYGFGSGSSTEPIYAGLREFIFSWMRRGIVDATPIMIGTTKEGITEMMEERVWAYLAEMSVG